MNRRIDYDRIAPTYDRARHWERRVSEKILELGGVSVDCDEPILEIGCGTGNATTSIEALTRTTIVGLDLSAGMLRRAAGKLRRVRLLQADAQRLPLAPRSFRMVLAVMMLHHVPDRADLFSGCARVLAPGGALVIVTTGHDQIRKHFLTRFFPSFAGLDVERFPDIPVIVEELRAAGFVEVGDCRLVVAENTPAEYLEKVRRKHLSTFHLMSASEYRDGLASLEKHVHSTGALSARASDPRPIRHHGTILCARTAGT